MAVPSCAFSWLACRLPRRLWINKQCIACGMTLASQEHSTLALTVCCVDDVGADASKARGHRQQACQGEPTCEGEWDLHGRARKITGESVGTVLSSLDGLLPAAHAQSRHSGLPQRQHRCQEAQGPADGHFGEMQITSLGGMLHVAALPPIPIPRPQPHTHTAPPPTPTPPTHQHAPRVAVAE